MKTHEEINCGLECIRSNASRICIKPENGQCPRCEQLVSESLGRIQQLETERHQLLTKCERLERERDAAVKDLKQIFLSGSGPCDFCAIGCRNEDAWDDIHYACFEWRGVCPENTKEEQTGV